MVQKNPGSGVFQLQINSLYFVFPNHDDAPWASFCAETVAQCYGALADIASGVERGEYPSDLQHSVICDRVCVDFILDNDAACITVVSFEYDNWTPPSPPGPRGGLRMRILASLRPQLGRLGRRIRFAPKNPVWNPAAIIPLNKRYRGMASKVEANRIYLTWHSIRHEHIDSAQQILAARHRREFMTYKQNRTIGAPKGNADHTWQLRRTIHPLSVVGLITYWITLNLRTLRNARSSYQNVHLQLSDFLAQKIKEVSTTEDLQSGKVSSIAEMKVGCLYVPNTDAGGGFRISHKNERLRQKLEKVEHRKILPNGCPPSPLPGSIIERTNTSERTCKNERKLAGHWYLEIDSSKLQLEAIPTPTTKLPMPSNLNGHAD